MRSVLATGKRVIVGYADWEVERPPVESFPVSYVSQASPFGYSREMNRLIRGARPNDVILLNDDAVLQTSGGFDELEKLARENPEYGVLSAAVTGVVKKDQRPQDSFLTGEFRNPIRPSADRSLSFICVYIRREILERLGGLDERFIPGTYGFQDNDYCERVVRGGWKLGIVDSVVVEHGNLVSSYRSQPDLGNQLLAARGIFSEIWGEEVANLHWNIPESIEAAKDK